jgi:hypothetical protein
MHRRRGGKFFSLARHVQVRTTATATKQAVSAHTLCQHAHLLHTPTRCFIQVSAPPSGWGVSSSRPTTPPSPLTTSTPAGLGKWAPPISKWAKPKPQKPPVVAENWGKPALQRRNSQAQAPPWSNQGFGLKPSASFKQPRDTPAPGKWTRPPGFTPPNPTPSTSANPVIDEPITRLSRVPERSRWTDLRSEQEPEIGKSHRSFVRLREDEHTPRQNRRWEGSGRHKSRGSLLSRQDYIVPDRHRVGDVKTISKPKAKKAKKALRVNPDINIPSTVSVGNFARLLNVSLGKGFELFDYGI